VTAIPPQPSTPPDTTYSPSRRTALVFLGTGTAGAYHAGVLRALVEAGVRIDLVAGRGVGAVSAFYAAADAGPRLWDESGIWSGPAVRRLYRLRPLWRWLAVCLGAAALALVLPLALALLAGALYPVVFVMELVAPRAAQGAIATYRDLLAFLLSPELLSSLVPRVATLALFAAGLTLFGAWLSRVVGPLSHRRARGGAWGHALGAPSDAGAAVAWATSGFWQFIRGAASIAEPPAIDLARRFGELLAENLGQPGYRELVLVTHDLDARRDLVFGLLAAPHRAAFLAGGEDAPRPDRAWEVVDLAGAGRDHLVDALAGALSIPLLCEPHRVGFAPESAWRGETHRLCDRPDAAARLLDEVALAGATQVIVVSAVVPVEGPHALSAMRPGLRPRVGEWVASSEAAALDEAIAACGDRFWGVYRISPPHNPLGPLDLHGGYDDRSDRAYAVRELIARGYDDAYRSFVEPVVGASGEDMRAAAAQPAGAADLPLRGRE